MAKKYFDLRGYPCSRVEFENEALQFLELKKAMNAITVSEPLRNLTLIFGTGGEVSIGKSFSDLWGGPFGRGSTC